MARILITGASGFAGRHLAPFLARAGFDVRAASRDATLQFTQPAITTVRYPASSDDWAHALDGVDGVVHLAGLAHRPATAQEHDEVNHRLAADAAQAAMRAGVRHFVFVSSIAAQTAASAAHVVTEADTPRPAGAYGEAKLAAEAAIRQTGVPFSILRPVVIGGPGAKGNLAILERVAALPVPLPLNGLQSRRSTLSIQNFNSAVRTVLFNAKAMSETFVVADPDAMTVAGIVTDLRRSRGRTANLFTVPPMLLRLALIAIGKGALWERLGQPLVVDPAKLISIGWTPERP